jgi:hypothetical protein
MIRFLCVLSVLLPLGCSSSSSSLYGSVSQVYDLSFNSVQIVLEQQASTVQIKYIGDDGDPAILSVDIADISDVANTQIDLTQTVMQQPRGVLDNVGTTTTELPFSIGTVTFDSVPTVGKTLSGTFAATLTAPSGYTLDGTFSATVAAP